MWENVGCGTTTGDDSLIVRAGANVGGLSRLDLEISGQINSAPGTSSHEC